MATKELVVAPKVVAFGRADLAPASCRDALW
jgi:hypothetical protein